MWQLFSANSYCNSCEQHSEPHLIWQSLYYGNLPLYNICVLKRTISRSTHCRGIHPKSFWFAYSWGMSLFWSHSISLTLCREPAKKHFYPLILTLFTVLLQFHNFFADENIGAQKYHFEFLIVFLNVLLFPIHWIHIFPYSSWVKRAGALC